MQRLGRLRTFAAMAFAAFLAFVAHPNRSPGAAPATRPATAPAATRPHVPFLYRDAHDVLRENPRSVPRLTAEEAAKVLHAASESCPEGQEIWFVLVRDNNAWTIHADVFYTPDKSAPRLCRGKWGQFWASTAKKEDAGSFVLEDYDYIHVSPADRPFKGVPEVPAAAPLLPFRTVNQKGLSDEDLVRLVDAARSEWPRSMPEHPNTPIQNVTVLPDHDGFDVNFGWEDHRGDFLRFVRADGGFRFLYLSMWTF